MKAGSKIFRKHSSIATSTLKSVHIIFKVRSLRLMLHTVPVNPQFCIQFNYTAYYRFVAIKPSITTRTIQIEQWIMANFKFGNKQKLTYCLKTYYTGCKLPRGPHMVKKTNA